MAKIVTVISGKGGTGKTTVAVNVACGFKRQGYKTLLIDCSFGIRNDDIALNKTSQVLYNIADVLSKKMSFDDAVVKGEEEYMPDFLASSVLICPTGFSEDFFKLIKYNSHQYDFIVIDTPASTGAEYEASVSVAHIILAVVTEDYFSVSNTSLCLNRIDDKQGKKTYIIFNKCTVSDSGEYIEDMIDELGCPLIGIVNDESYIYQSLTSGDPIVRYDTYAGREFENICNRLCNKYTEPVKYASGGRLFDKNRLVLKNNKEGFN